jgi:hypothetical protein
MSGVVSVKAIILLSRLENDRAAFFPLFFIGIAVLAPPQRATYLH